jgi:tetratricopeptide (TPR) repeat protein
MNRPLFARLSVNFMLLGVCAGVSPAQVAPPKERPANVPAPVTRVTVDGSEAMFTTMVALYAAGYEGDVSADNWSTFRAQIRERARQQKGPAVEALREYYTKHQLRDSAAMLSHYVWFGLVAGRAPKFEPVLSREQLPPEVLTLEGFSEILSAYYKEQNIGKFWVEVQPVYNREIERLHDQVTQVVFVATTYLREVVDPAQQRSFTIIVEPLVGRITNVRNYVDHYAIILSGGDELPVDTVRHAYLHFLLDPLPLMYSHVVILKRPLFEAGAKAPRLADDLKDDYFAWFSECTVRAVELKLRRMSPGERDAALNENDAAGYVIVRPIYRELTNYGQSEPAMKLYFPDLVRAIDLKVEQPRVASIKFAEALPESQQAEELSNEEVARRKRVPTTIPNDQDAIAALTEGERRLAEKNPRAAEISFRRVLAKYPDQIRAWYGLGMVAILDHDAVRAKEVFGRLTVGDHAASADPMVMAWSHVYLARILEDEGQVERAKAEYQAAITVQGAPSQAQQAAQKGLGDLDLRKTTDRP